MKKFNLVNEHLAKEQKVTLVFQGYFGGMSTIQTTYLSYKPCKPAPHYQNCPDSMIGVNILHKPKGKRNAGYKSISYNIPLIIYDDWRDIDTENIVYTSLPSPLEDITLRDSKYTMHDDRYFAELLETMPDGIILSDI